MKKDFNTWFKNLTDTIADYDYFNDWPAIYRNANKIKIELNLMNSLIGSKNIEKDFDNLFKKYPEIINCLPTLIAVREKEINILENKKDRIHYKLDKKIDINLLKRFMDKFGLFELISKRLVANLFDYATGVEVGIGTNGRKNRGGHLMENLVEYYIKEAGYIKDKNYFKEMRKSEIESKFNISLSNFGIDKRFDYVIKTKNMIYGIECNFFKGGGSKLNETARAYQTLANNSINIKGFKFMLITDGEGWKSTKNGLQELFNKIDHIYNLKELNEGVLKKLD